ncbi:hypothetical protein [Novosphingobium sp. 9]|uniref:hypothetical protein n=1 Tax=Novosphingobium sp. 9 TaxID=2025349 RepID=UPI0021B5041C|nr:hypothetical protein [Novosphingobium sp. 9]
MSLATSKWAAAALALGALASNNAAQAADSACLTRSEASSLMTYALPDVISGTAARCQQALPPGAFLPTGGNALAQRYSRQRAAVWPAARAAFLKFAKSGHLDQGTGLFAALPEATQQQLVGVTVQGFVAQAIPLDQCSRIDTVIGLMAPLPPKAPPDCLPYLST